MTATPAATGGREAPPVAFISQDQVRAIAYDDPTPSPAWMRAYYVCACGFEYAYISDDPFTFKRVPHRCLP